MSGYTAAVWVVYSFFVLESYGLTIIDTITPSCTVKTSDGTVDLSSIATAGGNTDPAFKVNNAEFGNLMWNPCNDFTVTVGGVGPGNQCTGELIVQSTGILQCITFGTKSSSSFSAQNNQLVLNYNDPQQGTSSVTLTCDSSGSGKGTFSSNGDTNSFIYKGKAACPGGGSGGGSSGLSGGSILLIIALCLIVVYVVAGIIIQKVVRHKEGPEIFPNISFWKSLPSLVKDGVLFVFRCGKTNTSSYEDI